MHLSIRNLTRRFHGFEALADISLDIEPGTLVALVGMNGAGKTTFFDCLAGILGPTLGEILYDGEPLDRERLDIRRRFSLLSDSPTLLGRTPIEHIATVVELNECSTKGLTKLVLAWLHELRLTVVADAPNIRLSRGERYKAALVGLLAVDPEVWMLDEPFASGMDPCGIDVFQREVRSAVSRGRTVIYTTQLLEIAGGFSDRVCILDRGQLLGWGTLEELRMQSGAGRRETLGRVFSQLHC